MRLLLAERMGGGDGDWAGRGRIGRPEGAKSDSAENERKSLIKKGEEGGGSLGEKGGGGGGEKKILLCVPPSSSLFPSLSGVSSGASGREKQQLRHRNELYTVSSCQKHAVPRTPYSPSSPRGEF